MVDAVAVPDIIVVSQDDHISASCYGCSHTLKKVLSYSSNRVPCRRRRQKNRETILFE
jgi:hypothetical protein